MFYLREFIIATIAAIGFGLIFDLPKKAIYISSLAAGLGWIIYKAILSYTGSVYLGSLVSALVMAATAEVLARIYHYPASVFILPGIINLCPGEAIYKTMTYFIANDNFNAISSFYKALGIAAAIAFGVLLSSSFSSSLKTFKWRNQRRTDFTKAFFRRKKWKIYI